MALPRIIQVSYAFGSIALSLTDRPQLNGEAEKVDLSRLVDDDTSKVIRAFNEKNLKSVQVNMVL